MAWTEPIINKKGKTVGHRGRYRDAAGKTQDYKEHGKIKIFGRKSDAKAAAEEEQGKARRKASVETKPPLANITWGEWWDQLVEKRQFLDSDRIYTQTSIVNLYLRPKWGDVPLNKITHDDVEQWVEDLKTGNVPAWTRKTPPSPNYVHGIYTVFTVSIKAALKRPTKILDASPCAAIENLPDRKKKGAKTYIAPADVEKLAEHKLRVDYRDATDFMLETGLRPGEVCGLHDCRIDRNRGWMLVSEVFVKRRRLIRPWPKDEDLRWVPLTDRALEIVDRRMDGRPRAGGCGIPHSDDSECDSALIFRTLRGKVMHPDYLSHALKEAAERAGLPRGAFQGYGGRRGWATRAADGGLDPYTIAAILGHETLDMALEYVQQTPWARQKVLIALGARPAGMPVPPGGGAPHLTVLPGGAVGAAAGAHSVQTMQDHAGPAPGASGA